MSISAVILAHNEMNSVGDIVRGCRRYCDEVFVVDDGSTDRTSLVSKSAGAIVIRNSARLGIVKSTQIGLRATSGDVVVTLDADGQHDPSEICTIAQPIIQGRADLVLGTRDGPLPFSEQVIRELVNLRVRCDDPGTGYRAFRANLAKRIRLWGFCLCGSLVIEAHKLGARIVEIPTRTRPRRFGKSHWASWSSRTGIHGKQAILILKALASGVNYDNDVYAFGGGRSAG